MFRFLDTVDEIAQELVSGGLIDGHDLIVGKQNLKYFMSFIRSLFKIFSVAANLQKIIENPSVVKSLIFALVN